MVIEQLKILKRVDYLINRKATGTSDQLATRLNISRRSVFRLLDELKAIDAPVQFSKHYQSYVYKEEFDFNTKILEKIK